MQKQVNVRPNYQVVRQLMEAHLRVSNFQSDMEIHGVKIIRLEGIDLFKIVLDVIGFPPGEDEVKYAIDSKGGMSLTFYDRDRWDDERFILENEDIDRFLERLYADYDDFLLTQ